MNGKQEAILWGGLALVGFRLFTSGQWSVLWDTFSKPAKTSTTQTSSTESNGGGTVVNT
jgi:hypothetical protein